MVWVELGCALTGEVSRVSEILLSLRKVLSMLYGNGIIQSRRGVYHQKWSKLRSERLRETRSSSRWCLWVRACRQGTLGGLLSPPVVCGWSRCFLNLSSGPFLAESALWSRSFSAIIRSYSFSINCIQSLQRNNMPFSISAYFNFQVTLPRSALYESILDMSSSFSRRNCISRNWVASNLAQYFQVNLLCSSFRVSNLCVRSFIFSFLVESCYYNFRYFSHMMSVISLLFLQQLHSAMARGYRMVLYLSLGGFLIKTALVLFNLAKEGAFCKGVFGKKTSPFLRGLIYVGKGDVSPVFLYYQKTRRLLVGVEKQEWSSVMELLKVSICLQLGWLDKQVTPSKMVFLKARGLYPSFFGLYNPSKEASFSLVYHSVCRSLRFTKLILTGPSVWTISGQTSNWLMSMMAVCSCCSVLLRFFSEVFESWLEAGLRWKGFFLAERLASPQELVAEVYLLSSLRVDGELSMGHYNYFPHLQSYPVLTLAVLGLSSCFMLSGCIEGCVMIWVYRIIRIHQGRR